MSSRRLLGLVLLCAMSACTRPNPGPTPFAVGTNATQRPSNAPYAAGWRSFSFGSPSAPSPIQAELWYPAAPGTIERPVFYSSAYWGFAAPRAKLAPLQQMPLVVLAHGWRGTRFDLAWIAEGLTRHGYVVASLDSPDSDAKTFEPAQAPKMWFRAALLKQLIDAVGQRPELSGHVDVSHSAVIGHSAGGSSAFVLAGAEIDPVRFSHRFPESAPVIEGPWSDRRIHAVVALNPGTGPVFTQEGLHTVFAPTLILSGKSDQVAPEATNARVYATGVPDAVWESMPNVNHYSFMPVCSFWGRWRRFGACLDVPELNRETMHEQALGDIEAFLSRTLPVQAT